MTRSSRWSTSICNLNALETESKTPTTAKTSLLDLKRENMQEADKVGEERRIKPLVMSKSKDTLVAMNRVSIQNNRDGKQMDEEGLGQEIRLPHSPYVCSLQDQIQNGWLHTSHNAGR